MLLRNTRASSLQYPQSAVKMDHPIIAQLGESTASLSNTTAAQPH
jgi:hypothetical protein